MPIRHTVVFRLPYPADSVEEQAFLDAARTALPTIPGVRDFTVERQVSPKSHLTLAFSMRFDDDLAYAAYDAHPSHVAFVRSRWETEVEAFQEYDYTVV
jgi:Stress responsive A/B Barrel Domain